MKILIACELSGIVREEFRKRGHDAMSCDLLPTEIPGNHYQGDIMNIIDDGWDMMIAHPPCTYMSNVGIRHFNIEKYGQKAINRQALRALAFRFFMQLIEAPIEKICVENPVGFPNTAHRKPDQIIHPYYFGDPFQKRTCLWLKGLPLLTWDKEKAIKPPPLYICKGPISKGKKINWVEGIKGSGKERKAARSKTFLGIAKAMSSQWKQ